MDEKIANDKFSFKADAIEKFLAIGGILAQAVIATKQDYIPNTTMTPLSAVAVLGLAYVGIILGRHLNPEKSIKKAAFLTIGGSALIAAGVITDFSGSNIKDTLMGIPAILVIAGFFPLVENKENSKKPKM